MKYYRVTRLAIINKIFELKLAHITPGQGYGVIIKPTLNLYVTLFLVYPYQMESNVCYSVPMNILTIMYIVPSQDGWTPLHVACQEGHDKVTELLLQAGATVEQETKVKWSVGQEWVVAS